MSRRIVLPPRAYNLERLDSDLRAAFPGVFEGLNSTPSAVFAVLSDRASESHYAAVFSAAQAHDPALPAPRQQAEAHVRALAQSAAGVPVADLTSAQVRALLALLLYRAGAVDAQGRVALPERWE